MKMSDESAERCMRQLAESAAMHAERARESVAARNTVTEIEYQSPAWWDLVNAAEIAKAEGRKLSISIDANGRGEPMIACKVGESVWSAHRVTTARKA